MDVLLIAVALQLANLALLALGIFFCLGLNNLSAAVVSSTALTLYCGATLVMVLCLIGRVGRAYLRRGEVERVSE